MRLRGLKRTLGLLTATAAVTAALPAGSAMAGQCYYDGVAHERGDRIVSRQNYIYMCISTNVGMYWQYMGTSPGTGPWQP